jgi:hypothetical protein
MDPTAFSSKSFDRNAWLNGIFRGTDPIALEEQSSKLLTEIQIETQESVTRLEDTISVALSRLPRSVKDLEAVSAAVNSVTSSLEKIGEKTCAMRTSQTALEKLHELGSVSNKLKKCDQFLQSAADLSLQVEHIETRLSQSADEEDVSDVAEATSSAESLLKQLQEVDSTFGSGIRQRIDRFESELQKKLERDCLELLRKEDKERAPKLLATLRKIGRETSVLDSYCSMLVQPRKVQFLKDLSSAGTSNFLNAIQAMNRSTLRHLKKDENWFAALFPTGHESQVNSVLRRLFNEISPELELRMSRVDNNDSLVKLREAFRELEDALMKYPEAISSLQKPLRFQITAFLWREDVGLKEAVSENLSQLTEAVTSSARRVRNFFPEETESHCRRLWSSAVESFASNFLSRTLSGAPLSTNQVVEQLNRSKGFDSLLKMAEESVVGILGGQRPTFSDSMGIVALNDKMEKQLEVLLLEPLQGNLSSYRNSLVSELSTSHEKAIREISEYLMELPNELERCGMRQEDVDSWTLKVALGFKRLLENLGEVPSPREAQVREDFEYFKNVLRMLLGEDNSSFFSSF